VERGVRVTGPAPAARVWEDYAVPARWPRWAPHIVAVDTAADRLAAGVGGRVHGPCGAAVTFRVTDVDEPARTWAWDVYMGPGRLVPLRLHLRHGVEEHPRGCATWLTIRGPAPAVVAYLPVARLALRRLVRAD
jgi:uncharacterized protein YndB with AHSA1/START domain